MIKYPMAFGEWKKRDLIPVLLTITQLILLALSIEEMSKMCEDVAKTESGYYNAGLGCHIMKIPSGYCFGNNVNKESQPIFGCVANGTKEIYWKTKYGECPPSETDGTSLSSCHNDIGKSYSSTLVIADSICSNNYQIKFYESDIIGYKTNITYRCEHQNHLNCSDIVSVMCKNTGNIWAVILIAIVLLVSLPSPHVYDTGNECDDTCRHCCSVIAPPVMCIAKMLLRTPLGNPKGLNPAEIALPLVISWLILPVAVLIFVTYHKKQDDLSLIFMFIKAPSYGVFAVYGCIVYPAVYNYSLPNISLTLSFMFHIEFPMSFSLSVVLLASLIPEMFNLLIKVRHMSESSSTAV